jgi:hypothetical protein
MRKAFYRMIAWIKMEEQAAEGPWKWIIGRAIEDKVHRPAPARRSDGQSHSLYEPAKG